MGGIDKQPAEAQESNLTRCCTNVSVVWWPNTPKLEDLFSIWIDIEGNEYSILILGSIDPF